MRTIEPPWETWRAVVGALRAKGLPYMLEHADAIEREIDRHAPDVEAVSIGFSDDAYLRSFNWARWTLGIPLLRTEG